MSKKREINAMIEEIRRRGGVVHIAAELPDDITREFLQEILDCPLCEELEQHDRRLERDH